MREPKTRAPKTNESLPRRLRPASTCSTGSLPGLRSKTARSSWAWSMSRRTRSPTAADFLEPAAAIAQARRLVAEGADILDIGAESTRPYGGMPSASSRRGRTGAARAGPRRDRRARRSGLDRHAQSRDRGLGARAGAAIVNDVWGLQRDPGMARVVGRARRPRHHHAQSRNRRSGDRHHRRRHRVLLRARSKSPDAPASRASEIVLDPGIGFGKTPEQSIDLHRPARRLARVRPAAPDRRIAQALHRIR